MTITLENLKAKIKGGKEESTTPRARRVAMFRGNVWHYDRFALDIPDDLAQAGLDCGLFRPTDEGVRFGIRQGDPCILTIEDEEGYSNPYAVTLTDEQRAGILADLRSRIDEIAEHKRAAQERKEEKERKEKERAAQLQAEKDAAAAIPWDADGFADTDLYDRIMTVAPNKPDHRFRHYIKEITSVDVTETNGYMFKGETIGRGTIRIDKRDRLFLVVTREGSNKHNQDHFALVALENGRLVHMEGETNESSPGWALRMKPHVIAALERLGGSDSEPAQTTAHVESLLIHAHSLLDMMEHAMSADDASRLLALVGTMQATIQDKTQD